LIFRLAEHFLGSRGARLTRHDPLTEAQRARIAERIAAYALRVAAGRR